MASPPIQDARPATPTAITDEEFKKFQALIYKVSGISLSDAKRELLVSRLGKRLRFFGLHTFDEYYAVVVHGDKDKKEIGELINCITTNKTDFFRENHHFKALHESVFPKLTAQGVSPIRIWCSASSTGEEPYSLAITAARHFGPRASQAVKIYASDIDTSVLAKASTGVYEAARFAGLADEQWKPFFSKGSGDQEGFYRAKPEIRGLLQFKQINLIDSSWPWTEPFDMIFCRNVIIYFDKPTQERLFQRFAQALKPGGYLFLGHSEVLHGCEGKFTPLGLTSYRMAGGKDAPEPIKRTTFSAPAPAIPAPAAPKKTVLANAKPYDENIIVGGVYVSNQGKVVRTLLGSCVAACLWDPVAKVGGMNHFMLPNSKEDGHMPERFGVHAMELLINNIMKAGGDRFRLQAKAFGGADVVNSLRSVSGVGQRNTEFIIKFLEMEKIPLVAKRLGGRAPLEVRFNTGTGQALCKEAGSEQAREARVSEERAQAPAPAPQPAGDITLF